MIEAALFVAVAATAALVIQSKRAKPKRTARRRQKGKGRR